VRQGVEDVVDAEGTEAARHATGMMVVVQEAAHIHQGIQKVQVETAHRTLPAPQENWLMETLKISQGMRGPPHTTGRIPFD